MWGALWKRYVSDNLALGLVAHTIFEYFESRPSVIAAFSTITDYPGDSLINIVGDTLSFYVGFYNEDMSNTLVLLSLLWVAIVLVNTQNKKSNN
jgi:hypothetical protein